VNVGGETKAMLIQR